MPHSRGRWIGRHIACSSRQLAVRRWDPRPEPNPDSSDSLPLRDFAFTPGPGALQGRAVRTASGIVNVTHEYTYALDIIEGYVRQNPTYWLSDGNGGAVWGELHVRSRNLPVGTTLDQFAHSVRDGVQQEWRRMWPDLSLFRSTTFESKQVDGQPVYTLRYRVQESPRYCILDVEEVLAVGGAPPGPTRGFRLQHRACVGGDFEQSRRRVLDSFRLVAQPAAYYTRYLNFGGMWIKAAGQVESRALHDAADKMHLMLERIRPDILACLQHSGTSMAIIPRNEKISMLPEFAYLKGQKSAYDGMPLDNSRGQFTIRDEPIAATSEENVLELPSNDFQSDITMHEFAHAIQEVCFNQADHAQINAIYKAAQQAGLFPGTYAMSNVHEFFAAFSEVFFNRAGWLDDYWVGEGLPRSEGRQALRRSLPLWKRFMKPDDPGAVPMCLSSGARNL